MVGQFVSNAVLHTHTHHTACATQLAGLGTRFHPRQIQTLKKPWEHFKLDAGK